MTAVASPLRATDSAHADSPAVTPLPPGLFPAALWRDLEPLIELLDAEQSLWLSGYLAGQLSTARDAGQVANQAVTPAVARPAPAATSSKALIAFGSETGNSTGLASELAKQAAAQGMAVEVVDLAQLKLRQLGKRDHLLLICSTHGDGDPPEPIHDFFDALMDDSAPRLERLRYSVLALGDSSYEQFCLTGRQLDERLAALGAQRLTPREECDVDFAAPAAAWMARALAALKEEVGAQPATPAATASIASSDTVVAASEYSKKRPLQLEVLENVCLSAADHPDPVFHLELGLETDDFSVEPGDAVGVLADNPPALVAAILDATGLSGDQAVTLGGEAMPLVQALREQCDLTIPSKRFLETWAEVSGSETLRQAATAEAKPQREFLRQHQIRDLVAGYPGRPEAQPLVDALRPLQPRLYDVANSLTQIGDELHLTVKRYHYPFGDRLESGIATSYLAQLQPGDALRIYPHRNARFRLPDDPTAPLILIAEGTGIAPYRAFIQELNQRAQRAPCWLIFTAGRFEEDFLYQVEWQQACRDGLVERFDTLFYDDQPGRSVADLFRDRPADLTDWLQRDAHIYLCGDKALLTVSEADLQQLLDPAAGLDWKALDKAKRIHRNLY